jgi:hypothetical protein
MKPVIALLIPVLVLIAACSEKDGGTVPAAAPPAGATAVHPDLSGTWQLAHALATVDLRRTVDGTATDTVIDRTAQVPAAQAVTGALAWTEEPSYKPELRARVQELFDTQSRSDSVFYCGRPGVPRIGPPRRIVQLPTELIFFYEDIAGDIYRVIPTDGRKHRADADPSYYGDSIGHWEGDQLVIDVTNFVEDTWFGEGGYFHTDAMDVTERLWREGSNLVWQVTVTDPNVLQEPWTMAPRVVPPSDQTLMESPPCIERDANRLLNNDHHGQRLTR